MDIKSLELAETGESRIEWAARAMPVLEAIKQRFEEERPLENQRIAACLHVTAETANLIRTLRAGGAEIRLCASNPLSTQDDVAAALATDDNIDVYAIRGADRAQYFAHLKAALDKTPTLTIDDGADLVHLVHTGPRDLAKEIRGGTEETTTGVTRLVSMAKENVLAYPVIAVNNAATKHLFDNRYGTGQSTIDGILRATNRLLAGAVFVVAGYGWCGRGVAKRAEGMGAQVIVTEVDPVRALEAVMDGYRVLPMTEACTVGDIFCTVTGNAAVIGKSHFKEMKDGAMLCNAGHFNVEIDLEALERMAISSRQARENLTEYRLKTGQRLLVLGEGRLVNLAAAEGHPSSVMDMSFANQALSAEYLVKNGRNLKREVHDVPKAIDEQIAALKLQSMGIAIDTLTAEQTEYLTGWRTGT
jgi:adenosylhomocysteinase